ncbi:DUF397 domain-containing protein [Streptomyces sp. 3MP-14]|uniref:DUF397 domain-containing protein n=1 Tax=Streptomyces mimosae TaxID=2586635 RepID=A0A5N6ACI7_9ACTN|nr:MULTISPECIES: DUF397 domain-containing protein [Streptomyces]KAB8166371.1 DUF397 domain-containing protein [Streptomyces mimosae]KAB8174164.1 DUF397 domain-containing protein [Streptomyces sp. 3MP-14]
MRASHPDLSAARWRKSSYSNGGNNNCVEVADGYPGIVPVRDSKTPDHTPLVVSTHAWQTFIGLVTR